MQEKATLKTIAHVYKFKGDDETIYHLLRSGATVNDVKHNFPDKFVGEKTIYGNIFLNEGINYLWRLAKAESGLTPFNESNCHIGVGNGTTSESAEQTGLQGTSKFYKSMDSGYPKVIGTSFITRATFESTEANFDWNEWTVANGNSDSAININRKRDYLGTKVEGYIWTLELELVIS